MKKEVVREAYEIPRLEVRGIFLEGVIAESYTLVIGTGDVKYNEYETVAGTQDGDILLF
jgi:hypothetical protein